ncbi:F-actin-monooxygenase Mical isoform X3 [Anastrepha ludens]|uniref:F-actin-monooxygenase Mical isoform X3 n=1 Tax=Anastrepha ludens TaxID=28586 RepID=UPI0023AF452D|nr:F-actin-monooxygenase Mical isoform X3 [Anastrepha ludens]
MSRPSQQRTMQQPKAPKQHLTEQEAIAASELFDLFCVATTMRQILGLHRDMCDILGLRSAPINEFYPMLKAKIRSWKAQALWKKFDARAAHRVYAKGTACNGTHVLVIGAGPCGLRTAIEAQLLGAKVVVLEKRDRITRNNVLHLWPFVITDLRNLGAKKFYGKFCAGSIDHISIRQLQIILMKVALLLGVEIHENVSFERTIEPSGDGFGWRAAVTPADHVVSYYEFDVLIGADGKRNTLEGFKRKEFRGKLAIAITANFINKKTEAEAKAEEISGVAFIFNQSFFKELYEKTGIDLENIVYYKDETHYFVMTAKKHSLIDKGVILQDFSDPAELLAPANVSADKLLDYAREAAEFSTKYQMPNLEFAVNHYGKPDVAMFDFTSMFAAEASCRVIVRHGYRLLQCLVGDSLLEPFWPTGSGCARGFLSSMDAAYATKLWSNTRNSILGVVAQRESIYRLLNQTTPENLQRDTGSYTVDPASRYPNLNRTAVNPFQVKTLVDSDDPKILEQPIAEIVTTPALAEASTVLRKPRRSADIVPEALLHWVCTQLHLYDFVKDIKEPADILKNGKSLCALISRFRPDLIDYAATRDLTSAERNSLAFRILEAEYQTPRIMTGEKSMDLEKVDTRLWLHYLNQVREVFRGEVPYLKHPKMDITELREKYRLNNAHAQPDFSKLLQLSTKPKYPKAKSPIEDMVDVPQVVQRRSVLDEERVKRIRRHEPGAGGQTAAGNSPLQGQTDTPRRAKKRRNAEKAANIEERQKRLQEIEENRQDRLSKRRQQRYQQTQNFYKSLQMLQANTLLRETDDPTAFEDYSLFVYRQQAPEFNDRVKDLERKLLFPDRNRGDIPSSMPRNNPDEQFTDRIKSMEQRISSKNAYGTDKKPKDLMRAIGKIDSTDWNVREIEKKIEQSKRTEIHGPKGREKVPKWSKEQFLARQNKMAKPTRQESVEEKFKEIDQTLKNLDKQLKEGSILEVGERGRNKVASIAGQFVKKDDKPSDEKNPTPTTGNVVPKSSAKVALAFKKQAASEKCHFCKQIVYLMEKITAEDLVFHRSCLKCHHCHTNLRLGGYAFDRDDPNGRFYCTQHYRLPAKAIRPVLRKPGQRKPTQQQQAAAAVAAASDVAVTADAASVGVSPVDMLKTPDKLRGPADSVVQLDLLDRGQTPERIEFENTDAMSDGEPSEEHILDEHEWSGRNFLPESNQDSESDLSSSDDSDTESDADMFEEANDSPLGAQTLQLATDWIGKQHYSDSDDSDDFYDSSEGIADDDGKDDTEGEDFKKARELRREEVRLLPLPANLPTDTETEVQSESESSSPEEVELNSATEISTDSEFDHDELTRDTPKILIDDTHLRKPTKVQVKSTVIASTAGQRHHVPSTNNTHNLRGSYLQKYQVNPPQPQFKPLVQVDPTLLTKTRAPLQNPRPGDYLLNKTASTEGIASKKSLELKKRYLLGEQGNGNKIQKSGSTSVLDSRIRSFQSNISECQKLLNPGSGISPSMKTFLDRTKLGENANNDLMRSATTNILNDLKVEITIQKASSTASTDNEKENVFVNSKNELNKGMEYSETVNAVVLEAANKKSPSTPTNNHTIMGTIDLVSPDKEKPVPIIDLTNVDTPTRTSESNIDFIQNIRVDNEEMKFNSPENNDALLTADSNKIIDLTSESPVKSDKTIIEELKPDVSKDVKESIPDILGHIGQEVKPDRKVSTLHQTEDQQHLLSHSCDEEKMDSPEKLEEQFENDTLQIQVPNIPWSTRKTNTMSSTTGSSCTSNSSSIEDIQHYILESTTSPDTQTGGLAIGHQVPRVEIHDTSGTLMQIDSLMIIDGKYIGDPDDLKYMEIPEGVLVPETPTVKTTEIEDENEADMEPVTATPEPVECTVIETNKNRLDVDEESEQMTEVEELIPPLPERGPPIPERGPPNMKTVNLKFDTKNDNKVESLKNLPLIVDQIVEHTKAVKPVTLNLNSAQISPNTPTTPTAATAIAILPRTPTSPLVDSDITPTGDLMSRGSDSETELTGTGQVLTETELSDWTADDCISENFVDMEFVLNSNKGTIKRNKKEKKRMSVASKLPSTIEMLGEITKTAPVAEFEGILKSIDIDDIEFMDTGSEGSCAEAYSATNAALLHNCGYMEFIETTTPKPIPTHKTNPSIYTNSSQKPLATKRDEKLGIDYIEQGACVLQSSNHDHDLLKTPVNEDPHLVASLSEKSQATGPPSLMTQSLTDSSTLNDLEDDSIFSATPNSQIQLSTANTAKTTTEESEALTVVTSPLDSSSPKALDVHNSSYIGGKIAVLTAGSTPSSSDKNPKTSQSTCTTASTSTASSSKATPPNCLSQEIPAPSLLLGTNTSAVGTAAPTSATAPKAAPRKPSNELSYEECVRALQQKITQISTGRDSDVRKQKRKSSKGEMPVGNVQTVIEPTPSKLQLTESENTTANATVTTTATASPSTAAAQIHKVPEIPTLTRKLEEITKERTKQKDLIHDLVMDKLQSKKQLNAEKRLHRSRQRTMLTSGYASGSSLSPTPKLAAATTTSDTNCTSRAHYHESTAATPTTVNATEESVATVNFRESIPLQKSSTYVSAYGMTGNSPTRIIAYQQRPFSEHLDTEQFDAFERYKLTKTPSFSYVLPTQSNKSTLKDENVYKFAAPIAPGRHNRTQKPVIATQSVESSFSVSTENLRSEARARARLKSNTELGLSPEEKMQLLRQRLHLEHIDAKNSVTTPLQSQVPIKSPKEMDRDRRLSASKSVNDLVYMASKPTELSTDVNSNTKSATGVTADFTSDPNLLLSSTSIPSSGGSASASNKATKGKSSRRQKDPERRKSLIQSLSSFFHKEKKDTGGNNGGGSATSVLGSAQSERPGASGNNSIAASGGADMGVFSRFRISPKTKEKSKDKDGYLYEAQLHNNAITSNTSSSNTNIHLNTTPTKSSNKKSSTAALSSSSPQLFIHNRPSYVASHDFDESAPPPIPPLPLNYQRSDDERDESNATETREQKRQRAISKAVRQAELKRLRIAQEIQREQEEIEVQLRELEARGVRIEKALRGESEQHASNFETHTNIGSNDEKLLKELLEIWRNIKQLKKRDEELGIRQQELQLEHRHAQLKEELNLRLSCNKLDKSSADVAAEGAILNEMLEIVAKRAALRPTSSGAELLTAADLMASATAVSEDGINLMGSVGGARGPTTHISNESNWPP